jgi:ABC-type branched-subunit amino acid transport system ATPase component/ABC-type branched-subunit amino acid transport system permease subunit
VPTILAGLFGLDWPDQVLFTGAVTGLAYGVMAVGVILVFRSSHVINFAVAAMGAFAAALLARLVVNWGVDYWFALPLGIAAGALIGAAIELTVVRRLFSAPRVILLIATVGVAQLLQFGQYLLPQPEFVTEFPTPFHFTWVWGDLIVQSQHLVVIVLIPVMTGALAFFLNRTRYGTAIRASAANPDAARLSGISIRRMSTIVWVLAGTLSAVATIAVAPLTTANSGDVFTFGPGLLLRVLAAALIARMTSMTVGLLAGVLIGVGEAVLFYNYPDQRGILDAFLLLVVLLALLPLARRGRTIGAESSAFSFSPRVRPLPPEIQGRWWARRLPHLVGLVFVLVAVLPIVLAADASDSFLFTRVLLFALVAASLTILTGWAGQLSLGQFAFVGLGAMSMGALVRAGLDFVPAVIVAAMIAAAVAVVVGFPALRIPGLYLAVTTLAFAVATVTWVLTRDLFRPDDAFTVDVPRETVLGISLGPQRTYYAFCLIIVFFVVIGVTRLRATGVGRSLLAVRDNERAAASVGLSPARVKLTAFALSGAIAGLAGGLFGGLFEQFEASRFAATESLLVVAVAVVGGLSSVGGVLFGALFVVGLPALFQDSDEIALLTSGVGLLILLMYFPGGFVQAFYAARDTFFTRLARRMPEREAPGAAAPAPLTSTRLPPVPAVPESLATAMSARDVTVSFGGRAVVVAVDLEVRRGEVVGLIGANGAGKSTLMNAICGFVPCKGRIEVLGRDVGRLSPARRARLGLGRSFQGAELFPDLTVRETVQTALESRARSGLLATMVGLPRARRAERAKAAEADEIIAFLGLGRFANRFINELSTGTRRIVELACLMASGARALCLDEPTAGIAQRESEAFGPLMLRIREALDASLLVIEHDMPLVMGISDRVYCLEAGRIIAEGVPQEVREDPLVIASYLGTDEHAIHRSGSGFSAR